MPETNRTPSNRTPSNPNSLNRPHVVIIGSGFAGLFAARALAKADVMVTIIARTNHHLFQPLLYQVATGILAPGEVAPPLREVLKSQRNIRVLQSEVTHVNLAEKYVTGEILGEVNRIRYDHLIVAAGAGPSYFGNDHFAEYAPSLKTVDDALEIRARIFGAFEVAELLTDPQEQKRMMTFAVVGAGPTGVEMVGQIQELAQQTLRGEFRHIDTGESRVILLDALDSVLGAYGDQLSTAARRQLEELGIEVRLGAMVTKVDETGLEIKHKDGKTERIESVVKIWAAGVEASPLGQQIAEQSGSETDKSGRVKVGPDLTVAGHPEVFVVGDMMAVDGVPGVAQGAIQSGHFAARVIADRITGRPAPATFRYNDRGSMAIIAKYSAIAKVGPLNLTGLVAWLSWLGIHLLYLVGFKNRFFTLLRWALAFVGDRTDRTTTRQQLVGRLAIRHLGDEFHPTIAGEQEGDAGTT